jgi:RimJ/RimL family protein N-acetyltransferase
METAGPHLPRLETARLVVRPFELTDLDDIHRILDVELADAEFGSEGPGSRQQREDWLRWSILNYEQLARLYQPPYGERAIVLRASGELIGACGCVPSFGPFHQLPFWSGTDATPEPAGFTPEFGLYYAMSPRHQGRGYTVEAVGAVVAHVFEHLHLERIVATTTYENAASIRVMEKLGMSIQRNPLPDPPWFQVVGVLTRASRAGG